MATVRGGERCSALAPSCSRSGALAAQTPGSFRRTAALRSAFVLFLSVFFQCTEAVLFEVPGNSRECFFVPVNAPRTNINGRYESFRGSERIRVTVEGPVVPPDPDQPKPQMTSQMLFSSTKESSAFKVQLPASGFFKICVGNTLSYAQTVTLNFHVAPSSVDEGSAEPGSSKRPPDVNQLVMSSHTEELKNLSDKVLEMANGLFEQQSNSLARMAVHEQLGTSTRNRASLWKVIQMCSQIVLSLVHIYAVRSHFEVKTIV
ncbi:conserved hypothetical protein [Neospora caninum Liverpool]|uniref:GOLD domain-containing protein n=1 Tax=Neospora caninum (strain Liverpool) TaxID=572307 RepID=F0VKT4_NEOCL|nr:conserved hypothetical protein [Neospora caninum Liverpool]CBZ54685.1 conserved hypothetical protein [Neospora caninum Liverpool]CEL69401.1 TPA: hypothetical protein BN1204_051110 [Neospora caninum Liverpool]|eukprot:XP_003884715.1 conserved hypothetical protein [Neospora caninum Liverpool]